MNRKNIRVTDPVLSKLTLGYGLPTLVGHELFPYVDVDLASGKIIQFGKEAYRIMNTRRAPGTKTKRVTVGYENGQYSLTNNALDAVVPVEWLNDQQQVPGIMLQRQSVQTVMQIELNNLEYEQATLARDASKYDNNHKKTLSGTDKWSDYSNSDPIKDVKEARAQIRSVTGQYPNKMLIPVEVHETLCEHPKLLAKLSNNERKILTVEDYQQIFQVKKVVIGTSILTNENDNFEDLWGKDVVLSVVPETITTNSMPSYGYTYRRKGHPSVEKMWYDKSIKSWVGGVDYERQALHTGMDSGFLLQNVM